MKTQAILTASLLTGTLAQGGLTLSYQFNGNGNWSIDAVGSNSTPVGMVQAEVPVGSTVEKAFLYSSTLGGSALSSVGFDGTLLTAVDFTALGSATPFNLQAYRADVTSQVAAKVAGGSAAPFNFQIDSESPNNQIDGEVLAVVYSNPGESQRTIAFLDGASAASGDSFSFNTASLPDPTAPGFEALLSLGIGFGFQGGGQYSEVDVNGRRLTTSAGGQDDGGGFDGGLITVGGLGDNPANPVNPNATPANASSDDEYYNLALGNGVNANPFVSQGDTGIFIQTRNPSNDDNIFFAGFNITAEGNVIVGPPNPPMPTIPEPSGVLTLAALLGFGLCSRRRQG